MRRPPIAALAYKKTAAEEGWDYVRRLNRNMEKPMKGTMRIVPVGDGLMFVYSEALPYQDFIAFNEEFQRTFPGVPIMLVPQATWDEMDPNGGSLNLTGEWSTMDVQKYQEWMKERGV